jgi:hypothetical protein
MSRLGRWLGKLVGPAGFESAAVPETSPPWGVELRRYFENNPGRRLDKWLHYFEVYDRHLRRFRGTDVHVLEIGVQHGGGLQMWKSWFGDRARVFGADLDPRCESVGDGDIRVYIGDQADRGFLQLLKAENPRLDVLIDDGGHTMEQQLVTFDEMFSHLSPEGVYVCEDLQTSYWDDFGGGYRNPGSFIEFAKTLVDKLHAWHSREEALRVDDFTRSTHSLHFYDGILVVEKRPMEAPRHRKTGRKSF